VDSIVVLLALPSAAVLAAMTAHGVLNRGARATAGYLGALFVYGGLRAWAIRLVSREHLGAAFPYLMSRPVARLLGVSAQELLGWAVAVTLAWVLSDRLLRRVGVSPTPHRVTAMAGIAMALVCLAVENAATAAGWWTWTLALPRGRAIHVPTVAFLDWGFVASDFLLPFLALATRASWRTWAPALVLFPLHMRGHGWLGPLPGPVPVAGNDLVHVGIAAYVLMRAVGETGRSPLPDPAVERARWVPAAAALVVVAATAVAGLGSADPRGAVASVPLLILAMAALPFPRTPGGSAPSPDRPTRRRHVLRFAILAGALVILLAVRVPAMRRQQEFLAAVQRGLLLLNQGNLAGAQEALRSAIAARPGHAGGHTLLAVALLRQGRRAEARAELDEALDREPTAGDALELSAVMDLEEGQTARAAERAALGRRVEPDRAAFTYLEAVARGTAGPGKPAAREAVEVARRGGAAALAPLSSLAARQGDEATVAACREAMAGLAGR